MSEVNSEMVDVQRTRENTAGGIKELLRKCPPVFRFAKKIHDAFLLTCHRYQLKQLAKQQPCRIVVGSGNSFDQGWIPTDIEYLNLLKPKDWERFFRPASIDAILAEHVWEHLTKQEGIAAAKICFTYLKSGGYLRIAVPDGLHPDPRYIEQVRVGGTGSGADDHKVLYTYKTLKKVMGAAGFRVNLLEYFDENNEFHYKEWDCKDGTIHRSKRFDERNKNGKLSYTSIIVDAIKDRPAVLEAV